MHTVSHKYRYKNTSRPQADSLLNGHGDMVLPNVCNLLQDIDIDIFTAL